MNKTYKTAIVHDLVLANGGADSTLESIVRLYPSPIFTLIADHDKIKTSDFKDFVITDSFIQKLPWGLKKYRNYLPLYPLAVEQFNLEGYDVILSSSFIVAKGAISTSEQLHICYLHNPIRAAWELYHRFLSYSSKGRGIKAFFIRIICHYLRNWDVVSANRVDHFIANSTYTAKRIKKLYRRDSVVIYPPVDVDLFELEELKDDYFVTASRLVYHKRMDLIVDAFKALPGKKLIVIGDGPELKRLRQIAPVNVEILGYQSNDRLIKYLQKAKAFLFAAHEDFGIAPIEAMSCGTPVIAFGGGGCSETVIDGKTGLLFTEQTAESIIKCVEKFESGEILFEPKAISMHAQKFSRKRFEAEYRDFVEQKTTAFFEKQVAVEKHI
ncbi:glycosyltransferase [Mucilaginibacter agri]|uniref:Glycosyltransferase n=1 Tax=Mucilaginibacter agri TaxID=2695265 RepID=A0A965ZJM5_9SPHI|nr:glycosyltransferase [Mucilaginibacter agri]NCD72379.1 glycosyltransferase [Mucilaginibacter agri]